MHNDANFCRQSCFGVAGYHGSCCRLEQRDWIIGPVTDCEAFLARLGTHLGRTVHHSEVFMDHAEGSAKFSDRPVWQSPQNFPAMRVTDSPDHRCTPLPATHDRAPLPRHGSRRVEQPHRTGAPRIVLHGALRRSPLRALLVGNHGNAQFLRRDLGGDLVAHDLPSENKNGLPGQAGRPMR